MSRLSQALSILRRILTHPRTRGERSLALLRFLFWQAWERILRRPLDVRAFGTMTLRLRPHEPSCSEVFYTTLPDYPEMRFVQDVLRPGDGFLDVGANAGVYTLLAASVLGRDGAIVAVEPDAGALAQLRAHVELNRLSGTRVVHAAAGDREGWVRMTRGLGPRNHVIEARHEAPEPPGPDWVRLATLDALCAGRECLLGKVDVEGYELEVLEGAAGLLERRRPAAWILETNRLTRRYGASAEALGRWIADRGGAWCGYDPASRTLRPVNPGAAGVLNAIAVFDRELLDERLGSS